MEKAATAAAGEADVPSNTSTIPLIPPNAELHYGTGLILIDDLENMGLTKLQKWNRSTFGIPLGTCISVHKGNYMISSGKHMIMHAINNDGKHFEIIVATNGDTQQQQAIESLKVKKKAVPPSQQ